MTEAMVPYPWQTRHWQSLTDLVTAGRLPHALLLSGPEGIGKTRLARAFAGRLLCDQPNAGFACGQCQACRWNQEGQHPDFVDISFAEGKKQISVDQIRNLQGLVVQRAHREDGYKIVVLRPAEAMNISAANALLKTLEEPTPQTLLILISHAASQLLPTIRSRCMQMAVAVPDTAQSEQWLRTCVDDPALIGRALAEGGGRPLAARQLIESGGVERFAQLDEALTSLLEGNNGLLTVAETLAEEEPEQSLQWWVRRLQSLIGTLAGVATALPAPWRDMTRLDSKLVFQRLDDAQRSLNQVSRGAALNKRLLWEGILLDWRNLCHNTRRSQQR